MRVDAIAFGLALSIFSPAPAVRAAPVWVGAAPGNSYVKLNWRASAGSVARYELRYRASNSSDGWVSIKNLGAALTAYTVTGLENLKSYEFQIGAANGAGAAAWSTTIHARPRGTSHPSGLHGGGQINAIVKAAGGTMVAGGDVAGFQRSLDGGETWFQSSRGVVQGTGTRAVASLAYHRASGTIYAVSGGRSNGNFLKSADNGARWVLLSSGEELAVEANSSDYPRRVGRLIAVDPANAKTIYLGTLAGIGKSTDGGVTWAALALTGDIVRSLIIDNGLLYAAIEGKGVYRCTPSGAATPLHDSGAPNRPEEIVALRGTLYVAANTAGILRLKNAATAAPGAAWANLEVGSKKAAWCAIDGYVSGDNDVLVAGNAHPDEIETSRRYTTLMKCANAQAASGFKWTNISSAETAKVDTMLAAGNGETYWRVDPAKGEGAARAWAAAKRLDGPVFAIDQILIDPDRPNKIHVAGQMGIWRTLDGGMTWQPAVLGLGAAVHNAVAVDPNHAGWVYVGDTDNGLWVSHDHAESAAYCTRPPSGSKPTVRDIDVDAASGLVYTAIGEDIWAYDPVRRSWFSVKDADGKTLKDATGGKTPHGVEAGQVAGALVVLAAVEQSGIWRLAPGGNWTKIPNGPNLSSLPKKGTPFEWPAGASLVYFHDGKTGVWRSQDAGRNWKLIWSKPFGGGATGSVAVAGDTSKLFVAAADGLFRLDHADAANPVGEPGGMAVNKLAVPNPGQLAASGNTLWVAGAASPSGTANVALWKSTDGSTFTPFKDDYYEGAAGFPLGLVVEDGFQYTAAGTMGLVVSHR
ncbi:MAG: fibronectin type III domain-containing protein [Acidobacteria bacterium]|nr:fibronectin type III domain-containing protein [Acidobacteriota bacterium]